MKIFDKIERNYLEAEGIIYHVGGKYSKIEYSSNY